jgi:cysteinyl-tRNA synthetase
MDDSRKEMEKLVCERVLARADRDYDKADSIREDLKSRFG